MPRLSPEQIEQAQRVLAALKVALEKALAAGGEYSIVIPDVPAVTVHVSDVPPSQSIAEAVAASRRARTAYEQETAARRVAALVISVLAEVGEAALGPAIGILLAL